MNKKIKWWIIAIILISIIWFLNTDDNKRNIQNYKIEPYTINKKYNFDERRFEPEDTYDTGYYWAENNSIDDFSYCDYEFGAGTEAEDGCNEYVKENGSYESSFSGYECTEDCSGHQAGYDWAESNFIDNPSDCGGYSQSFIEGCRSYAEEN